MKSALRKFDKFIRSISNPLRIEPDFIIIGGMRCGTTSLFRYIMHHPSTAAPRRKEIRYFDKRIRKSIAWYRSNFPLIFQKLLKGERVGELTTGEGTVNYLYHPCVPARVKHFFPNIKLFVLLRDPVQRTISHYKYKKERGKETYSFKNALRAEEKRLQGTRKKLISSKGQTSFHHKHHAYLNRSQYYQHLKNWLKHFDLNQFLILPSARLFKNPQQVMRSVFSFLDLPIHTDFLPENPTAYNSTDKSDSPLSSTMQKKLRNHFEPYNQKLYQLVGSDYGWVSYLNES